MKSLVENLEIVFFIVSVRKVESIKGGKGISVA